MLWKSDVCEVFEDQVNAFIADNYPTPESAAEAKSNILIEFEQKMVDEKWAEALAPTTQHTVAVLLTEEWLAQIVEALGADYYPSFDEFKTKANLVKVEKTKGKQITDVKINKKTLSDFVTSVFDSREHQSIFDEASAVFFRATSFCTHCHNEDTLQHLKDLAAVPAGCFLFVICNDAAELVSAMQTVPEADLEIVSTVYFNITGHTSGQQKSLVGKMPNTVLSVLVLTNRPFSTSFPCYPRRTMGSVIVARKPITEDEEDSDVEVVLETQKHQERHSNKNWY